ncbi:MAG: AgmX/PglI C-terminal domain-containing protein [Cystobacterineae bacterium]|nr:AgmX/PglI C-terminal domain-containing protein [Cystobacterineae bacterium]
MIKDEKVGPKGAKVRCKKCSHIMTIRLPDLDSDLADEATIRMPFPEEEEDAEAFFAEILGIPSDSSEEMPSSSSNESASSYSADDSVLQGFEREAASSFAPAASADLGSLFDDAEPKAPVPVSVASGASGLFGALDDEELGDAFERAISQRPKTGLHPAPAAALLPSEPSIVVSQGLSAGVEWFVAVGDSQIGPLDISEVKAYWQQGKISRDSLCWKSGMKDWEPIGALGGLVEQLNAPVGGSPTGFSPPPESEAASVDWQPSAASALASLVKDELQGLAVSPLSEASLASMAEAVPPPPYGAASVASEIPFAPPPSGFSPAPSYGPVPSSPAIYIPPTPPPARTNKIIGLSVAAGGLLLVGLLVAILVAVMRKETPLPPAPVVVQAPTPPQPPPEPLRPAVEPPPQLVAQEPQTDSSQALAQQLLPPKQPPAKTSERKSAKNDTVAAPSAPAPTPPRAPSTTSRTQDDFDKAFGTSQPTAPKRQERPTSVYVPPPPGGGGLKQSLSDADILEYILSKRGELKLCVEEQKTKDSSVKGNMVVEWNVATSGKTSQVKVVSPNFQGTHFANCVTKRILGWQFPSHRTAGGTRKFNFKI